MRAEKAKEFFSEEKNQKTFVSCCRGPSGPHKYLNLQKSFASFLQKRRPCFLLPHAIRFRASPGRRMGRPQGRLVLYQRPQMLTCKDRSTGRRYQVVFFARRRRPTRRAYQRKGGGAAQPVRTACSVT